MAIVRFFSAAMLLWIAGAAAMAQTTGVSGGQIRAYGQGQVWAVPDQFSFEIVVESRGTVSQKLSQQVNATAKNIVSALHNHGVNKEQINSMGLEISPWYQPNQGIQSRPQFMVSRRIMVTMGEVEEYPKVLDKAIGLGATRIVGYHHFHSDRESLYRIALEKAMQDAYKTAGVMAKASGAKVGPPKAINENVFTNAGPRASVMAEASASGFAPGQVAIKASVEVVYQLTL